MLVAIQQKITCLLFESLSHIDPSPKEKKTSTPDADMSNSEAQVEDESTTGDKSIAEIILRKYGLYKGPINYRSFKSLGHYYYLKNNRLLNK